MNGLVVTARFRRGRDGNMRLLTVNEFPDASRRLVGETPFQVSERWMNEFFRDINGNGDLLCCDPSCNRPAHASVSCYSFDTYYWDGKTIPKDARVDTFSWCGTGLMCKRYLVDLANNPRCYICGRANTHQEFDAAVQACGEHSKHEIRALLPVKVDDVCIYCIDCERRIFK